MGAVLVAFPLGFAAGADGRCGGVRGGCRPVPAAADAARRGARPRWRGGVPAGGRVRPAAQQRRPLPLHLGRSGAGGRGRPVPLRTRRPRAGAAARRRPVAADLRLVREARAVRPADRRRADARLHADQPAGGAHDLPAGGAGAVRGRRPGIAGPGRAGADPADGGPVRRGDRRPAGPRSAADAVGPASGGAVGVVPGGGAGGGEQRAHRHRGRVPDRRGTAGSRGLPGPEVVGRRWRVAGAGHRHEGHPDPGRAVGVAPQRSVGRPGLGRRRVDGVRCRTSWRSAVACSVTCRAI